MVAFYWWPALTISATLSRVWICLFLLLRMNLGRHTGGHRG